jgi:hypothetical protein
MQDATSLQPFSRLRLFKSSLHSKHSSKGQTHEIVKREGNGWLRKLNISTLEKLKLSMVLSKVI